MRKLSKKLTRIRNFQKKTQNVLMLFKQQTSCILSIILCNKKSYQVTSPIQIGNLMYHRPLPMQNSSWQMFGSMIPRIKVGLWPSLRITTLIAVQAHYLIQEPVLLLTSMAELKQQLCFTIQMKWMDLKHSQDLVNGREY